MQTVICTDLDGKRYEVDVSSLSFRPSVYGIIIKDSKVLLSKQWDGHDFPGGGVRLGETIEQALIREVREETGFDVRVGECITCRDSFFKFRSTGEFVHSIMMYFFCEIIGGEASIDMLEAYEKTYVDLPEWIDLKDKASIKFKSTMDCLSILTQAEASTAKTSRGV